jgi:hypothetical protein
VRLKVSFCDYKLSKNTPIFFLLKSKSHLIILARANQVVKSPNYSKKFMLKKARFKAVNKSATLSIARLNCHLPGENNTSASRNNRLKLDPSRSYSFTRMRLLLHFHEILRKKRTPVQMKNSLYNQHCPRKIACSCIALQVLHGGAFIRYPVI